MSASSNIVAAMESAVGGVSADLLNFQQRCEIEIAKRLVAYSPVRSGHFRANWQHGATASPPAAILAVNDKTGHSTVARLVAQIKAAPAGDHTFVNNVPYAMSLEMGHSQQAPAGVVARVQVELTDIVAAAMSGGVT